MSDNEEKTTSPFDSESEEETIALSKDELNDILSEAEIVQETSKQKEKGESQEAPAAGVQEDIDLKDMDIEMEPLPESSEEEEFDISGEIDELSSEDLENIELEDTELESYSTELESELGGDVELPDDLKLEEEAESGGEPGEVPEISESEKMILDTKIDEEIDLDSYIDSVKDNIDLDSIELKEEEEQEELVEPPVLGVETPERDLEVDEAFKEAGIEKIEDETVTLDEAELADIEEVSLKEEIPGEEMIEAVPETPISEEEQVSEEPFEGEVALDEEEEKILGEDFDLSEGAEVEDVVTVSGEELDSIGEVALTEEITAAGAEEPVVDAALLNDITTILKFMDTLLGDLPDEKIKEFSQSEYFPLYKEVFEKLKLA